MSVLTTVAWRSHRQHPWLAVLAILGIALGVAVSTAIALANAAARQAFTDSVTGVVGNATHQVVAGSNGIPEGSYAAIRVAAISHGGAAAPVVEAEVALVDHPGRTVRLLGVDPFAEAPFRASSGSLIHKQDFPFTRFLTEPGTIVVSQATAAALELGPTVTIRHGTTTHVLSVIATLPDDGNAVTRQATIAICDLATAQEILGRFGRLDHIDLRLSDGEAISAVTAVLPVGAEIVPAARRSDSLRQLTDAFHTNLSALGLIALVVGMFLIANTASFAVVRRRELFSRLRAHGATPGQILRLVLGEALLAGAVAAVVGVVMGVVLAQFLIRLVTRTIGDLYANIGPTTVVIEPLIVVQGLALGVLATVLAALWPALDAARSAPRLGLLRTGPEHAWRRALPWLGLSGGGLLVACAVILFALPATITAGFVGLGCGLVGAALLVPALLVPVVTVLAWPFVSGPLGSHPIIKLASRAVGANLSRTGIAVAALSVACAAALGMTLMVASFRSALDEWLATSLTADVYVSAPRLIAARVGDTPLEPALTKQLLAVPGIAQVLPKRDVVISAQFPDGIIAAVSLQTFTPLPDSRMAFVARPAFASAAERNAAWAAFDAGAIFVTEPFATHRHVTVGDQLILMTPTGPQQVSIAAVMVDYSNDQGAVFLHRSRYQEWFSDDTVTALALYATPDLSAEILSQRLRIAAGDAPISISSSQALKIASMTVFDRTFAITAVIRWLAAGVAVLGLIAALAAVQVERARTTARLRAIGVTPNEVIGLALGECLFTGVAAGLLALPIGVALAAGLTHVINRRSFGWSMTLQIDIWQLVFTVLLAAAAAVVAGLFPAWRASRRPLAEALHAD